MSMSGWSPQELANGYYRSGLRPVSKSWVRADVQDFRTRAWNNILFGGCKLVGSDFNMPVITTVDGGPVVEYTDTTPNVIQIAPVRTAHGGDIITSDGGGRGTMTRGV